VAPSANPQRNHKRAATVPEQVTAFAPGRVNLIGEHTDYNGGLALPFAIEAGVMVTATPGEDGRLVAVADDLGEQDEIDLSAIEPARGWRAFVRGVAAELRAAGAPVRTGRVAITGDVPQGGGLSSSAALEVALALALIALSGAQRPDHVTLARLCSRVENDWVGARTGLLDQLASLGGEPDHALLIDFQTMALTPVPLRLDGYRVVTLDSGEVHDLAESGYNERRAECAEVCERLGLDSVSAASPAQISTLPEPLTRRARHVISENARVEAAVVALRDDDLAALGPLLTQSHASLRDDYEVSTPAVEATVARLDAAGALGARIVGGGFGGNVLALFAPGTAIPQGAVEVRPGPGAHLIA
jgi:galactokinase